MRLITRTKRLLVAGAAGALTLSLLPAGAASASLHEDVCEGVPEDVFTDVAPGSIHAAQIDCIAAFGITLGVGDGAYDPAGDVRRDQMATFLANGAGLLDDRDQWARRAIDPDASSLDSFTDQETGSTAELTFTVTDLSGDPITTVTEDHVSVNVAQEGADRDARYGLDLGGEATATISD